MNLKYYVLKYIFKTIDIGSPISRELSNFQEYKFVFRGVNFKSMEGLLQGIKFKDIDKQNKVFELAGKKAKFKGKKSKWYLTQELYFQGTMLRRNSNEYFEFLNEAFRCLYFQNEDAKRNLMSTKKYKLIHSIGKNDKIKTVLTENEFVEILYQIRKELSI